MYSISYVAFLMKIAGTTMLKIMFIENKNMKVAKNLEIKCNIMHQCILCNSNKHVIRCNNANLETKLMYFNHIFVHIQDVLYLIFI